MLPDWNQWVFALGQFFQAGGWVLIIILGVSLVMLTLLLERLLFRLRGYRQLVHQFEVVKNRFAESRLLAIQHKEWERIWRCDLDLALKASFPMIKTLIAMCPMVGLLGTVSGMIQVFDSLALYGTGNPRLMASGVASATIPTMTGMAVAVLGLLCYSWLKHWSDTQRRHLINGRG